ncbi:MAG: hypothetical protein ACP5QG_04680 [candidate division WOR-3 bacterium]
MEWSVLVKNMVPTYSFMFARVKTVIRGGKALRYLQIVENIWDKKRKRATQRAVFSIPGAEGLELRCLHRALEILYENKEMIERAFRTPKSSLETSVQYHHSHRIGLILVQVVSLELSMDRPT